jgi:mono/diheme cytochrome c family protein
LPIAGHEFVKDQRCLTCHVDGGAAGPFEELRLRRDPEWLIAHARDPQMIAPGLREPPRGGMSDGQARSIASYVRKLRAGVTVPMVNDETRVASLVIGRYCANCHMIDGEGSSIGPDLTRIGGQRDAKWLHEWITQPDAVDPAASMPAFGEVLTPEEMTTIVSYLAARR